MSRREGMIKCGVCHKSTPAAFADKHHITPQSVGMFPDNSEDNLVWLCSGCHQNLHTLAHYLLRGANQEAVELAESFYTDSATIKRLLHLSSLVAKETIAMREGERELPSEVQVSVVLPRETVTLLKLMSLERRGHRQFSPFLKEHLISLASKYHGEKRESALPAVDHTDFV